VDTVRVRGRCLGSHGIGWLPIATIDISSDRLVLTEPIAGVTRLARQQTMVSCHTSLIGLGFRGVIVMTNSGETFRFKPAFGFRRARHALRRAGWTAPAPREGRSQSMPSLENQV
jgi:hypothetical protein